MKIIPKNSVESFSTTEIDVTRFPSISCGGKSICDCVVRNNLRLTEFFFNYCGMILYKFLWIGKSRNKAWTLKKSVH